MDKKYINKAESKIQFVSFCLVMRRLNENPNAVVRLPVFLDATCSGLQHLAGLLRDFELGEKVNITPKEKPEDLYESLVEPINNLINKYGDENIGYSNLSNVKINRKIVKPPIMTTTYNVTIKGVADQIKNSLTKIKIEAHTFYKVETKDNDYVNISFIEVWKMAEIIHSIIFNKFPSLRLIYDYFLDIVKLMLKLSIPIVWFTPSGLKITQHYNRSKKKKLSLSFFGKNTTMVFREWSNLVDKQKQVNAIIPNIIHSLDASHLISVLCKSKNLDFYPVITVHDCFGTLPNKLDKLSFIVRKEFVLQYIKEDFLVTFDNRIRQFIIDNNYSIVDNKVITEKNKYNFPILPKLGNLNLKDIERAVYMIT